MEIALSVLAFFSFCFAYIELLLLKKTTSKQNIITWLPVNLILLFCLQAVVVGLLSLIGCPITLATTSIINLLIGKN